jgi:hypothetical protein
MNIVLMTSRSGSSLVCSILAAHGLTWALNNERPAQLPRGEGAGYETFEHHGWKATLKKTTTNNKWPLGYLVPVTNKGLDIMKAYYKTVPPVDFVKSGVEFVGMWMALSDLLDIDMKFIKVRRPVEQIAASLARRGLGDVELGREVAERRFKLMNNIEGPDVHTDVLVHSGLWRRSGIREALIQCGVEPRHDLIRERINTKIFHT